MSLLLAAVAVAVAAPAAATRTHPASLSLSLSSSLGYTTFLSLLFVSNLVSLSKPFSPPSSIDRSIDRSFYLASFFVFSFLCLPSSAVATCYSC